MFSSAHAGQRSNQMTELGARRRMRIQRAKVVRVSLYSWLNMQKTTVGDGGSPNAARFALRTSTGISCAVTTSAQLCLWSLTK